MSTNHDVDPDPEDMFKDTRMSFGDHIEELRTHLIRAIKCFVVGMILGFWPLGYYVLKIIVDPVEQQLFEFDVRKLKAEQAEAQERIKAEGLEKQGVDVEIEFSAAQLRELGLKVPDGRDHVKLSVRLPDTKPLTDRALEEMVYVRRKKLTTMDPTEAFLIYLKVAMVTGLVLSSPWVFYHIWMFIAAGLYPQEKKLVNVYLPFSVVLFISGVLLCQFAVMPNAVRALLWFNEWLGMSADLRLSEWLWFALLMPIIFGVSFQTPLVMMFLHKVGICTVQFYRDYRRVAFFSLCVIAVVFMPTIDPWSILLLWLPLCGLYELGILLCVYQGEQNTLLGWIDEQAKSDEMVEV